VLVTPDGEGKAKLPTSSDEVASALGVLLRLSNKTFTDAGLEYEDGDAANYVQKGDVWVLVETDEEPAVGDPVYARYTVSGGNTQLGAFRTDDDSDKAAPVPNCRWLTEVNADGFAKVRVNLPGSMASADEFEGDLDTLETRVDQRLGVSNSYIRTDSGTKTLIPAVAVDRAVLITVTIVTDFDNGDGTQPTVKIGQTDTTDKFAATSDFTGANVGDQFTYGGLLSANKALLATEVAATGSTSTGAYTITAIAAPLT